jgi:hypothetical protein
MTTVQDAPFVEYTDKLRTMADSIRAVALATPNMDIDDLLKQAAVSYGTTASQMKYALSFAGVKKLVRIDYDSATVSAIA